MNPLSEVEFAQALQSAEQSVPVHLGEVGARQFADRFAVHRNNILATCINVLRQSFPVLECLLGEEYFAALMGLFVRQHPPQSPVLHEYGGELARFIEHFPPLVEFAYLPDIARLEWARLCAFHAADAVPAQLQIVGVQTIDLLLSRPMRLHPSLTLLRSVYPLHQLWCSQIEKLPPPAVSGQKGESVLIWRQGLILRTEVVDAVTAELLIALKREGQLGRALAQTETDILGLGTRLAMLFGWKVFCVQES